MTTESPIRRCCWLPRYSLRTMLMVVTIICVLLGLGSTWYCYQKAKFDRQQKVAEEIIANGGVPIWKTCIPKYLEWIGDWKALRRVTIVDIEAGANCRHVISLVRELESVQFIRLLDIQLNDSDLLDEIKAVKHVSFVNINVRVDAGPFTENGNLISNEEFAARKQRIEDALGKKLTFSPRHGSP